ncbi:MAG: neutral/alkaline non-lysosomal ceramidase N-terminal domain-containing protein, partial [bacterium]
MILAGAARVDITPRTPCRLAGYGARDHAHESVHDPLAMRALWLRDGKGADLVLITADILWFSAAPAERVKAHLEAELGLRPERVMLFGTHTHSAPDDGNPEWLHVLVVQAVAAAALARTRLRPGVIKVGHGNCAIGVNRRERTADGKIVLGRNPAGPCDRELTVLCVDDADGYGIARVANFACHGVVLGQTSYVVSGDWPGAAARSIERRLAESPFLFLQGGSGNVNPRIGPQHDYKPVEELAKEFEEAFFRAEESAEELEEDEPAVRGALLPVALPRKPGSAHGA